MPAARRISHTVDGATVTPSATEGGIESQFQFRNAVSGLEGSSATSW